MGVSRRMRETWEVCPRHVDYSDLRVRIVPYLIRSYDQTVTNIYFFRVDFYRVYLELSDDTMFDMIGPVFPLKTFG